MSIVINDDLSNLDEAFTELSKLDILAEDSLLAISRWANDLRKTGISRDDIVSMESAFGDNFITDNTSIKNFTALRSRVGVDVTMESLLGRAGELLSKSAEKAWEIIIAIFKAVIKLFSSFKPVNKSVIDIEDRDSREFKEAWLERFPMVYHESMENATEHHARLLLLSDLTSSLNIEALKFSQNSLDISNKVKKVYAQKDANGAELLRNEIRTNEESLYGPLFENKNIVTWFGIRPTKNPDEVVNVLRELKDETNPLPQPASIVQQLAAIADATASMKEERQSDKINLQSIHSLPAVKDTSSIVDKMEKQAKESYARIKDLKKSDKALIKMANKVSEENNIIYGDSFINLIHTVRVTNSRNMAATLLCASAIGHVGRHILEGSIVCSDMRSALGIK